MSNGEKPTVSLFYPELSHYRISPFISSQEPSWPDDGGQWSSAPFSSV